MVLKLYMKDKKVHKFTDLHEISIKFPYMNVISGRDNELKTYFIKEVLEYEILDKEVE